MSVLGAVAAPLTAAENAITPGDRAIADASAQTARPDAPAAAYTALATAFMRKSRETADPDWYRRATAALDAADAREPDSYAALRVRAWVALGVHDFAGARRLAEAAKIRDPRDWWNDATLADACVELGDYDCAEAAVNRLCARHPGVAAWTRAAWLRALFGDHGGALELLEMATTSARTADVETLAWTLVQLGHERFAGGDLPGAARAYDEALAAFPEHYLALGGLARVRAAAGRLDDAADLYRRATAHVPAPDLVGALGDVLLALDDRTGADAQYALLDAMAQIAFASGGTHGRQLAMHFADHDRRAADALKLARTEAATRNDIFSDDALAWTLYRNGQLRPAARAAHRALRLGTADAAMHFHAGMIAQRLGRQRIAARHLRRVLAVNPFFDRQQAAVATATLTALDTPSSANVLASRRR